jgi:hypothetical protein
MALIIERGILGSKAIKRVATLTGANEYEVMGRIASLWEASQHASKELATVDQIGFWLGLTKPEEIETWILALADDLAAFIVTAKSGQYKIRGNAKHIEKTQAITERNRRIALKRVKNSTPSGYQLDTSSTPSGHPKPSLPSQAVSREHIEACKETWKQTLKAFQVKRNPSAEEETQITRSIQSQGFEYTNLTLLGARFETKTENYDPKKNVSITRVLFGRNKQGIPFHEKLSNLGAQNSEQTREVFNPDTGTYETEGRVQ